MKEQEPNPEHPQTRSSAASIASASSATSVVRPLFQIGETVYSAIAPDARGVISGLLQRSTHYAYLVLWSDDITTEHTCSAIELSREPLGFQPTR